MIVTRRQIITGCAALAALDASPVAWADGLPASTGRTILTVSGNIAAFNGNRFVAFDRTMLEALGTTKFTTTTPWYDGAVTFEGVLMARLMKAVGAAGDTVIATALNDYETKIPISDFSKFDVLLAFKRDGQYMPVRDKGPLFIVYPFDSDPALKNQRYYGRSAWQLGRIVIT